MLRPYGVFFVVMVLCYLRNSEREYNSLIGYWSISISWISIIPDKGLIFFNDLNQLSTNIVSRNLCRVKDSTVAWKPAVWKTLSICPLALVCAEVIVVSLVVTNPTSV